MVTHTLDAPEITLGVQGKVIARPKRFAPTASVCKPAPYRNNVAVDKFAHQRASASNLVCTPMTARMGQNALTGLALLDARIASNAP